MSLNIKNILSIFDKWNKLKQEDIRVINISGGLSNQLYKLSNKLIKPYSIIVRIYGESDYINREIEKKVMNALESYQFVPKIYKCFEKGIIIEYLPSRDISKYELQNNLYRKEIIKNMVKIHNINIDLCKHKSIIFEYGDIMIDNLILNNYFKKLYNNWNELKKKILNLDHKLVICHNDIQQHNIMLSEYQKKIYLIDFEYSGYNYILFDIANYFNEYCFNYEVSNPPYYEYIPNNKVEKEEIINFIQQYEELNKRNIEKKNLLYDLKYFQKMSHIYWTIWSLYMVKKNTIKNNFDYYDYAKLRYSLYKST